MAATSAAVNDVVGIWGVVGFLVAPHPRSFGVGDVPALSFLGLAVIMAICSMLAVVGLFRRWKAGVVTFLMVAPMFWVGLLALGLLAVVCHGPV